MQLGKCNYEEITKKIDEIKKENSNEINENNEEIKGVKIMPYIFNMEEVLNIADLAICRSGAMTVTEILTVGIPAIFVPLPSENSNKQSLNAEIFVENNMGIIIDNDKVTVNGKEYDYKLKSKENKGDLIYYKIEQNGESYTIIFPDKDKNIAIMIQPYSQNDDLYGKVLYAMNKKDQPNYSEYVKKYIS